ncbi:MAG: DNA polymerase III subunit gamma/tau [Oscillospiraceae bacterium]
MYQALYRKYRPQTFSDVVGQQGVTDTLRSQLETGRLSHAYLFTGTRGTGKTSCAKILAKAVNCENLQDGNPCNACPSCRAIDSGGCMDVLEIDAASNNGVDSVRVLRDDAVYTPAEVKMRVYIIDEVHMLSTAAFNALLKIIEEPPEHLLFILATTELHKVPATILSRCQRFAFRRLTPEDIAGRLNFIAYQEGIEAEPEAIRMLARLADGGMRDGVSLLDQCASASTGPLTAEGVCRALGLAGEKKTAELMDAIAAQDAARALTLFSGLYANGMDAGALLDEMSALCRDLLILQSAPKSGLAMLSGIATEQQAMDLRGKFAPGELLRMLNLLAGDAARLLEKRGWPHRYGAMPDAALSTEADARPANGQRAALKIGRTAGERRVHGQGRGEAGRCGRRGTASIPGRRGRPVCGSAGAGRTGGCAEGGAAERDGAGRILGGAGAADPDGAERARAQLLQPGWADPGRAARRRAAAGGGHGICARHGEKAGHRAARAREGRGGAGPGGAGAICAQDAARQQRSRSARPAGGVWKRTFGYFYDQIKGELEYGKGRLSRRHAHDGRHEPDADDEAGAEDAAGSAEDAAGDGDEGI